MELFLAINVSGSRVWEDFISPEMKMDLGSLEIYVEEFDIDFEFTLRSGI